ncbi:putative serine/threonine-protein kinase [Iris pallida]|uniref:[RNA-polymerase]-subunit kinase n=1 Tax=Iris pallida TaxID=29817 RepID=A0AAX6HN91_IRIPA|nr:putative serine/threonine-protein kinase [Iris pallida]
MGCVCGRPSAIEDSSRPTPPPTQSMASQLVTAPVAPAKLVAAAAAAAAERKQATGPVRVSNGPDLERRRQGSFGSSQQHHHQRRQQQLPQLRALGSFPRAAEGEQVAAGWPAWLAAVAGDAIKGWVPRRADSFEKLDKIGQGTYSNVYRARDLDNGKIVALKKVRFDNLEPESVRFMAREIHILRRLDHPNVVKLEGLVTSRMSCSLYLVFEYMEHDLAGLASFPGLKFTEPQVKCYMQQLLRGLDHCHSRGVLHRDIKGSNLLIDNSGNLKIADFGLASFFDPSQGHPLTSRVVTLWYRPPELLLGATNYGVAVDLWSTGCILAEMYAGKPIMPGRTEVEQLHKIFKLCGSPSDDYWRESKLPHATIFKPQQPYRRCVADTFKDFPPPALELMETLLAIDPVDRGTAASALKSEFFTTRPLACDPSSLPKYPPSKEFDAKVRDEEARRQGDAGGKVQRLDLDRRAHRESKAIPAPDANAELVVSMQKWQGHANSKSRSEMFNPRQEDAASGFPIEPPREGSALESTDNRPGRYSHRASHSGPLVNRSQWAKSTKNDDGTPKVSTAIRVLTMSGSVAVRKGLSEKIDGQLGAVAPSGRLSESGNHSSDTSRKYDQMYHMHGHAGSHRKQDERNGNMDQTLQGYGPVGNNIHYSGPLRPSCNVDQMLKDHDRQIQEVFRRSRLDKSKVRKVQGEGYQNGVRPFDLGVIPVYPSSRGSVPVFTSSRGSMQQ